MGIYKELVVAVESGVSVTSFLITIVTSFAIPFFGFGKTLSDAEAMFVQMAQHILSVRISLICCLFKPKFRLVVVLSGSLA